MKEALVEKGTDNVISENELRREVALLIQYTQQVIYKINSLVNDLLFNIGLRIDNYDANQPVLNDKYLLFNPMAKTDDGSIIGFPNGALTLLPLVKILLFM